MDQKTVSEEPLDGVQSDAPLTPAAAGVAEPAPGDRGTLQPPASWCARAVVEAVRANALEALVYIASSERRGDEIGRAARQFAPDIEVLSLPPWDCLPYDRASPSREVMGRRMAVLARLSEPADRPRILIASVEALLQRAPPSRVFKDAFLHLRPGETLDRQALNVFANAAGYVFDDRIDEPGEIAIHGSVVDVFPAAADVPIRILLDEQDRILEIKRYDPLSQRTEAPLDLAVIGPASELILEPGDAELSPGAEHRAPKTYGKMSTVLERMPRAPFASDARADERAADFLEQVHEAHEARRLLASQDADELLAPDKLYLSLKTYRASLAKHPQVKLDPGGVEPIPRFALERNPGRAFSNYVEAALGAGHRVVVTGLAHELRPLARALLRGLQQTPAAASDWSAVAQSQPNSLLALTSDIDAGFRDASNNLVIIAAADVLGGRLAARSGGASTSSLLTEPDLRVGDVVIHEDHGLGVLASLERIEVDGVQRDAVRLEYHDGASVLAPVEEFGKIWRYGTEREAVTLDRLHTDAWTRRRAELSADIDRTAGQLVALAKARADHRGAVIAAPRQAYVRLAARFPYPETPDQAAAIEAVLADMASGRVMNRLVCGDVGFGKTEVALRAAAAVALCGLQVAVIAPTTVLARQHFETFRRRFAGTDITVGRLSRLATPKESDAVKAGLRDGSVRVVVGTHALAGKDVGFKNLGLVVIDEEQRFGAKLKAQFRELAPMAHRLTMTATPIPRTLQLAMVGIEDVSVIATPPARRRPIRTFLAPFDPATVRTALLRERRRGGQSFVVAPRIEDIGPLTDEVRRLTPELTVRIAHGELPPDEVDEAMVAFAAGDGDVLVATNIIESGLDVPRANTMLVTRADLFGLAQLHQLRGRVGRGRAQGVAYLFYAADGELPEATRARLSTLEAFDRLGSGLAISARDLDLRGAGDLIGDEQAGHMKLIGTALYQRLLSRAVRVASGEVDGPDWTPQLNIGLTGGLPESDVPDPTTRINLYMRLARITASDEVEEFAEELEDRFGPPSADVAALLDLARIYTACLAVGVARIDAGPKAIAFTPATGASKSNGWERNGLKESDGRLIWHGDISDNRARADKIQEILASVMTIYGCGT